MIKKLSLVSLLFSCISMASLPVDFWRLRYDELGLPLIDVQIASRLHTLMIDTGSGQGLHLYEYDLDKLVVDPNLNAIQQAPRWLMDVAGGKNKISAWKINRLIISNIIFDDVKIVSLKPWGFTMGGEKPVSEVLGLGLFHGRRVLMDFKNDRLQMLEHLPSDMGNWSSYPVEKTASGLRITVLFGNKPLYLIIDTAASHTLLFSDRLPAGIPFSGCNAIEPEASSLDCRVTKFTVADDKGKLSDNLAIVTNGPTPRELDFDGLLGIKFMRGHKVIFDMPESILYISR